MCSIMQSHYFKHFHWKLLSKNCQNKGMKSFDVGDSPLEQTHLTLPVWSKNWRNTENKNMSQEEHSSIIVMKRSGGLREASIKFISQKNPWWWWVLCQNKIPRGVFIKYSTSLYRFLNRGRDPAIDLRQLWNL